MIPYYSPHITVYDLFKSLLCRDAEEGLRNYFSALTGKRYILLTSSCRSALYLSYIAIGKTGIVHTSPLTCKVALTPVIASGNTIHFHDVKMDDWTISPESVKDSITANSIAIQAIHLGGFPCDMKSLREIADKDGLVLIEDCAQGFGSKLDGQSVGCLSDIACFTLSKNVFGIGGGILATNNYNWYKTAQNTQHSFPKESIVKVLNRIVSGIIATHRSGYIGNALFRLNRQLHTLLYSKRDSIDNVLSKELTIAPSLYFKIVACRLNAIIRLGKDRIYSAQQVVNALRSLGFLVQYNDRSESSYVKLFCVGTDTMPPHFIQRLNKAGIEAMHLEHKDRVYFQDRVEDIIEFKDSVITEELPVYHKIHDLLVSIPLLENDSRCLQVIKQKIHCTLEGK